MSAHPPTGELLESVAHFLRDELLPSLGGAQGFKLRISINAIDLVRREIGLQGAADERERARLAELVGGASLEAMRQALCEKIASGALTLDHPGLRQHLRATAMDRLAIDQPSYSAYRAAIAQDRPDDGNNNEAPGS